MQFSIKGINKLLFYEKKILVNISLKNVVKYCLLMYQCSIFGSGSANRVDPGRGVKWGQLGQSIIWSLHAFID